MVELGFIPRSVQVTSKFCEGQVHNMCFNLNFQPLSFLAVDNDLRNKIGGKTEELGHAWIKADILFLHLETEVEVN